MDTINTLQKKLLIVETQQDKIANAKYPTGVIIDLSGPCGNIFWILGICRKIFRQLDLDNDTAEQFNSEISGKKYNEILTICQQWFGFIYV
jgi:hypothetical protein